MRQLIDQLAFKNMKHIDILIIFLFLMTFPNDSFAQYSFEEIVSTTDSEGFYDAFEDQEGTYICLGAKILLGNEYNHSPFVVKISASGSIITSKTIIKIDTTASFQFGLQKNNGNYLFIGTLSDSITPSRMNFTYLCETNQELEIIQERYYKMPEPYHSHTIENYLVTPDQKIIVEGRADYSMYGHNDDLVLLKFDMQGNLLNFNMPENWRDGFSKGDILQNPDDTGFYLIGGILEYSYPRDWVRFDNNLTLLDYGDVEDSLSPMGLPLSVRQLSNGNYFMANASFLNPPYDADDLEIRILDEDFNIIKDTILYYDEEMSLPVHNGLDFLTEDNIWVSVFEEEPTSLPGMEEFNVHIFDSEMRLKGTGTYGGDKRYWLYDLTATSDGGCLIVGYVPDYDGSNIVDAFIIKIMPEDIITSVEGPPITFEQSVLIFPSPFKDYLYVESLSGDMTLSLLNIYGQKVLERRIIEGHKIEIMTSEMKPGVYSYFIENKSGIIETGKLIKN